MAFTLRARRTDAVVGAEMDFVDRLRRAHYWAIARRLEQEGRIQAGRSADWAGDLAFALTTPTVYEEMVPRGGGTVETAVETATIAALAVILEPGARSQSEEPPDWAALEAAAAEPARSSGADPARLSPTWQSTQPRPTAGASDQG